MKPKYSRTRILFSRLFKVSEWLDVARVREAFLYLLTTAKTLFKPQHRSGKRASFDAAQKKFGLTALELKKQQQNLLLWGRVMLACALVVGGVGVYYLSNGLYRSAFLSMVAMGIALSVSFRYHFFSFQIKQKRLGCTVRDWLHHGLGGEKK